jgi:competence protein ComEC
MMMMIKIASKNGPPNKVVYQSCVQTMKRIVCFCRQFHVMRLFPFKIIKLLFTFCLWGCNQPFIMTPLTDISFTVVNVGQGLSQIAVVNDSAIIFDMGPPDGEGEWHKAYTALGSPPVSAIFISHRDLDHCGGLQFVDSNLSWTGNIVTGYHEDTSFLRQQCILWNRNIQFTTIGQQDMILYGELCSIHCLWPPYAIAEPLPVSKEYTNHYSLVLSLRYNTSGVLLTGDVDSSGEQLLYQKYGSALKSDLMVVPHHGSRESVDYLFYAYVKPSCVIIAAGIDNDYGHPAPQTLAMLAQLGILYKTTAVTGSLTWLSNGFYWTSLF